MRLYVSVVLVTLLAASAQAASPTFNRDIFPILQKHCVSCHRPGEIAPMSLITYQEVRPWAAAMKESVVLRKMPPWYAEGPPGHFANDWRLSEEQIRLVRLWAEARAPEGDPADLPPARAFTEGWFDGPPSHVLTLPQEVVVPAEGRDVYPTIIFDHEFTEDTWIRGFEIRPSNRRVLHHANLHAIIPEPGAQVDWAALAEKGEGRNDKSYTVRPIHVGVPGRYAFTTAPHTAVLMPKGSRLRISSHYVPTGKPERDRTQVGIYYAEGFIDKERRNYNFQTKDIRIPANSSNYEVRGTKIVEQPVTVNQVACHMHLRGKSYRIVAELPDGSNLELMNVPNYSFDWQQLYELARPVPLPAGTRLHYIATYDNSTRNAAILAYDTPDREVTWGQRTIDEMMGGHVLHTADAEHRGLIIDGRTGRPLRKAAGAR